MKKNTSIKFPFMQHGRLVHFFNVVLLFAILLAGCKKDSSTSDEENPTDTTEEFEFTSLEIISKVCPYVIAPTSEYGVDDSLNVELSFPVDSAIVVRGKKSERQYKSVIEKISVTNLTTKENLAESKYSIIDSTQKHLQLDISSLRQPNYSYRVGIVYRFLELKNDKWVALLDSKGVACTKEVECILKTAKLSSNILDCQLVNFNLIKEVTYLENKFPQITLNYPIDSILYLTKDTHTYVKARAVIKKMELLKDQALISSEKNWESDKKCLMTPVNVLSSTVACQLHINVEFEEETSTGWIPLKDASGNPITEDKTYDFTYNAGSGDGIDQYIRATYPLSRQFNFYLGEYPKGYYLFYYNPANIPQIGNQTVSFKFIELPSGNDVAQLDGQMDAANKTIWFDIPTSLSKEKPYRLEMIVNSKVVHQIEFRTSKYNSISEKLPESLKIRFLYNCTSCVIDGTDQKPDFPGCTIYGKSRFDECFDGYEINGLNSEPLIQVNPILSKYDWFNASVYKQMYDAISEGSDIKLSRQISANGILPTGDQHIVQIEYKRKLTDDEIRTGNFAYTVEFSHIVNYLPQVWAADYLDVRRQLWKKYSSTNLPQNEAYQYIYKNAIFPTPQNGNYPILFQYKLPGKDIITTQKEINISMDIFK